MAKSCWAFEKKTKRASGMLHVLHGFILLGSQIKGCDTIAPSTKTIPISFLALIFLTHAKISSRVLTKIVFNFHGIGVILEEGGLFQNVDGGEPLVPNP